MANETLPRRESTARFEELLLDFEHSVQHLGILIEALEHANTSYASALSLQQKVFEQLVQRLDGAVSDLGELLSDEQI